MKRKDAGEQDLPGKRSRDCQASFKLLKSGWVRLAELERAKLVGEILQGGLSSGAQRALARLLWPHVRDEGTIRLYLKVSKLEPYCQLGDGERTTTRRAQNSERDPNASTTRSS